MSTSRPIIIKFLIRMLAYVLVAVSVVIVARKLELGGNETIALDALLAISFAAIGEYRAARAEFLLAQATNQLEERTKPPEKTSTTVVASRVSSPTYQPAAPARHVSTVPPHKIESPATRTERNLPVTLIYKIILRTLLVGLILFLLGLIFFIGW